jgi:hypothetical protein
MQTFKKEVQMLFSNKEIFEEAIQFPREKLCEMIIQKRKDQLSKASLQLQSCLQRQGRCPTCTLPTPCKHTNTTFLTIPTPLPSEKNSARTPESTTNRSPFLITYKEPEKVKKRLKVMEELQKYREMKLKNEILRIEENKEEEKKEKIRVKSQELKRKKYFEIQKMKLKVFREKKKRKERKEQERECRSSFRINQRKYRDMGKFRNRMDEIDSLLETQMSFIS